MVRQYLVNDFREVFGRGEIQTIIWFINLIVQLITLLIIVYAFLSYFLSPYHPVRQSIGRIIEPILQRIRRYVPPVGVLDLSFLILLILVQLAGRLLISFLVSIN